MGVVPIFAIRLIAPSGCQMTNESVGYSLLHNMVSIVKIKAAFEAQFVCVNFTLNSYFTGLIIKTYSVFCF